MTLITQRVTPFLWYPSEAEKAAETYVKIFGGSSRIVSATPMSVEFELEGQRLVGFNGGPYKEFNEAISLSVSCADQAEVDYFWEKLVEGGTPSRCGWLKDRWGLSWQVVPKGLPGLLFGSDPAGAQRAMQAMMPMAKLDIGVLERAYRGEG
jgi:predicted 3-demethylubiquinone-9 3-methyltransferase (glyoxalase superfamily)